MSADLPLGQVFEAVRAERERVRREAAEEMREAAAQVAQDWDDYGIAAAIRALPIPDISTER